MSRIGLPFSVEPVDVGVNQVDERVAKRIVRVDIGEVWVSLIVDVLPRRPEEVWLDVVAEIGIGTIVVCYARAELLKSQNVVLLICRDERRRRGSGVSGGPHDELRGIDRIRADITILRVI